MKSKILSPKEWARWLDRKKCLASAMLNQAVTWRNGRLVIARTGQAINPQPSPPGGVLGKHLIVPPDIDPTLS